MQRYFLLFFIFCISFFHLAAQNLLDSQMYTIAKSTPININTVVDLAKYWKASTQSENEYTAVAYAWVATHIRYDVEQLSKGSLNSTPSALALNALSRRKAVCAGYANLLVALLAEANVKAFVVEGYTRKKEAIRDESHAWVLVNLSGKWIFCDPTWGAGYVKDKEFYPSFSWSWYGVLPIEMIKTHLSFDVAWQAMPLIVLPECFDNVNCECKPTESFSCIDTLKTWLDETDLDKLLSIKRRIEKYGSAQLSTKKYLSVINYNAAVIKKNKEVKERNAVAEQLNKLVIRLNQINEIINRYFTLKREGKINQALPYINQAENELVDIYADFNKIESVPLDLQKNANILKTNIQKLNEIVKKELKR